jgi:hypothetical protein
MNEKSPHMAGFLLYGAVPDQRFRTSEPGSECR